MRRILIAIFGIVALSAGATVASADPGRGHDDHGHHHGGGAAERLFTLTPDPAGNPEGIAFDKRSQTFYVGITDGGAIYRGTLGSDTVTPFIEGASGKAAIGLKVRRGKLYVAGGPTGAITVYDLATRAAVATFQTGTGGFLNDLVVTRRGDVYVTDSVRPTLWHVTDEQVRAGSGTPQALDVSAIPYEAGQFNLNGIVARGDRTLVVVDTNSGKLFRIALARGGASIRAIDEITGATVPGGDGMLLDRGRLVVVQGNPPQLSFLKLRDGARRARLDRTQTSDKLRGPSTLDRAKGLYLVVNADFATDRTPFTVASLPRHGH
jgi:sugar lactone lactonase YvrE